MTRSLKGLSAALSGAMLMLGTTAVAAPASASAERAVSSSSWLGTCYPWNDSETAGGWCNGNGPNWTYEGWAICNDGVQQFSVFGPMRWAGDRRGSYGYCSGLGPLVKGYINVFYNGQFQFSLPA